MTGVRAVVFDWAGTMIDFGCIAPVWALRAAFEAHGVPITDAEARGPMGRAKRDHVADLLALPRVRAAWRAAHGQDPDTMSGAEIYADLEPLITRSAGEHATLIDGAADVAAELERAGIKVGSCTGYTREMMAAVLPVAAAQGYRPRVTICAGETPEGRPSPLMLWQALATMGAWPAGACIKVDDSETGISEGLWAGTWAVGVAASGNGVGLPAAALAALPAHERAALVSSAAEKLSAAGAHYVIDTVADLPALLPVIAAHISAGEHPPGAPPRV